MKLITFLLILISTSLSAQVYIDPTFKGNQNGTITNPYNKIPKVESNKTYLFKSGTQLDTTNITFTASNVIFGSYGEGKRPILTGKGTAKQFHFDCSNITIKNLEFIGRDTTVNTCIRLRGTGTAIVENCVISRSFRGIGIGNYTKAIIKNCDITQVSHDGIYASYMDTVYLINTNIWEINTGYAKDVGGDCFQSENVKNIYVDGCLLDHTLPGKFPYISNTYDNVVIKNSILIASNTGIYIGSGTNFTIDNCKFVGGVVGLWGHSKFLNVTNSVFHNFSDIVIKDGSTRHVENCTFVNSGYVLSGWNTTPVTFNKNIIYNFNQAIGAPTASGDKNNWYINSRGNLTKYSYGTNRTYLNPLFEDSINFRAKEPLLKGIGANINIVLKDKVQPTHLQGDDRTIPDPCLDVKVMRDTLLLQSNKQVELLKECLLQFQKSYLSAKQKEIMRDKINSVLSN